MIWRISNQESEESQQVIACTRKRGGELAHLGACREETHRDEPARGGEGRGRALAQAAGMGKPLEGYLLDASR